MFGDLQLFLLSGYSLENGSVSTVLWYAENNNSCVVNFKNVTYEKNEKIFFA